MRARYHLLIWLTLLLGFHGYFHLLRPLPYASYFADPELTYFFNSVMLKATGQVQHTDHPGTLLQLAGAGIAGAGGIDAADALSDQGIRLFRELWKFFCLVITLGLVVHLWRLTAGVAGGWLFTLLMLVLWADYNALIYWGTFTPEAAFFSIYIPCSVLLLQQFVRGRPSALRGILLAGAAMGVLTTLKLTLWPVTLFLVVVFAAHSHGRARERLLRAGGMLAVALAAYLVAGSAFAADRGEQWAWFFSLLSNSGRYGVPSGVGAGPFLAPAELWRLTVAGLRLQDFATLVPMGLMVWLAVNDGMRRSASPSTRLAAAGFLLCFLLSWLLFLKHPYQIKYLLVQTPLFVAFLLRRLLAADKALPRRFLPAALALLPVVLLTAIANTAAVHAYTRSLQERTWPVIGKAIAMARPEHLYFSLEVLHPLSCKAFALRETPYLKQFLAAGDPPTEVFRERSVQYRHEDASRIPVEPVGPSALVFTRMPFADDRFQLLYLDADIGLYIYRWPPAE